MPKTITINPNDFVKVKLTDVGKDIYYHQNDELNEAIRQRGGRPVEARMPKVDEEGYTSFQLHDLMTLYGPHIAGWKQLPFATNMLYEVQCKEPPVKPLTLDQFRAIYSTREDHVWPFDACPPYVFLESAIEKNDFCWISWGVAKTLFEEGYRAYSADNYGEKWRFWTRKPTDEERRAAAWIS